MHIFTLISVVIFSLAGSSKSAHAAAYKKLFVPTSSFAQGSFAHQSGDIEQAAPTSPRSSVSEMLYRLVLVTVVREIMLIGNKDAVEVTEEDFAFVRANTTAGYIPREAVLPVTEAAEITWRNNQAQYLATLLEAVVEMIELNDYEEHENPLDITYEQLAEAHHPDLYLTFFECLLIFKLAHVHNLPLRDALDWALVYMFGNADENSSDSDIEANDITPQLADD